MTLSLHEPPPHFAWNSVHVLPALHLHSEGIGVYDHCSLDNLKTSAEYEYEGEYGEKFSYLWTLFKHLPLHRKQNICATAEDTRWRIYYFMQPRQYFSL